MLVYEDVYDVSAYLTLGCLRCCFFCCAGLLRGDCVTVRVGVRAACAAVCCPAQPSATSTMEDAIEQFIIKQSELLEIERNVCTITSIPLSPNS